MKGGNGARRRAVITGLGIVSPLGASPGELHLALCQGRSARRPIRGFATAELPRGEAGEVPEFDASVWLGAGNLRPLDRTARLAAAAAQLALEASGWTPEARREHEVGLVLGTMFGSVHTISEFDRRGLTAGPQYVKPLDFANSVINAAAGQTAIWHDLRGVNSTISGGTASGLQALAYAADLVERGRAGALLAGGAEELCPESLLGFARAGLLAADGGGRPVPFDRRRDGFFLGEGAALLMVEDAELAERRGAPVLATLLGHAGTFDPSRGRDPERAAGAVARAVRLALEDAGSRRDNGLAPAAAVTGASGHPTADRAEGRGLAMALEEGRGKLEGLAVTAVKGALGEAPGASGAFQAAVLLEALERGELPGIAGLEEVDADLAPLSRLRLQARPQALPPAETERLGLLTCLGLDGNACALVLSLPAKGNSA